MSLHRSFSTCLARSVLIIFAALIGASCAETIENGAEVSLAPESRAEHVVFQLRPSPLFYGLSVLRCRSNRAMWTIGHEGGGGEIALPARIVYGEVPEGFVQSVTAQPLRPGCYHVVVSGPTSAEFVVNADGSITTPAPRRDTTGGR